MGRLISALVVFFWCRPGDKNENELKSRMWRLECGFGGGEMEVDAARWTVWRQFARSCECDECVE